MNLASTDLLIIALYFAALQIVGFVAARRGRNDSSGTDFILAGRSLTMPFFVSTMVATFYGLILGVGELIYSGGIVAWFCFMLPYYLTAFAFAMLLAERVRRAQTQTIPEQLTAAYGRGAGILASMLILLITVPAMYILTLGVLTQMVTGWELWQCILTGALLSVAYLLIGGLRSSVYTDVMQFGLMYLGFILLLAYAVASLGPPELMLASLPEGHTDPAGGYSWQYIVVWYVIALYALVDPAFHQRCAAARSPRIARKGILIAIGFWILFDTLTLACGLYAAAYLDLDQPLMAFPALGEAVLPTAVKGLFVVALLATVMSTLDSLGFISGVTIGKDIIAAGMTWLAERRGINAPQTNVAALTKAGIVISGLLSVMMAILVPSVVKLLYVTASVAIPGLLLPLVFSFTPRWHLGGRQARWMLLASSSFSALWLAVAQGMFALPSEMLALAQSVEPMFPGLLLSLLLAALFVRKGKRITREQSL